MPKKGKIQKKSCKRNIDNNSTRGQVDLIDLSFKEFNGMRFVMHYKDLSTNFSHFRALSLVANREVAVKLLEIFLVFGAPAIIQSNLGRAFCGELISEVKKLLPNCAFVHGNVTDKQSMENENEELKNLIDNWLVKNGTRDWPLALNYIQTKKNIKVSKDGSNAYTEVFGREPKLGLCLKDIPKKVFKTLITEERLITLLRDDVDNDGKINEMEPRNKTDTIVLD